MSHEVSKSLFLMVAHNAPHSANEGALLQAPPDIVRSLRYIESGQRRIYGAMVKKLDDSVGQIVEALHHKGILDNTIIVFISDNGGMSSGESLNYASNWPLRGLKITPFDGGIRVNGLIWSKNLTAISHLWKGYMHVVDWMPTLLTAIGEKPIADIDGIALWESIQLNKDSERNVMFEIDDYSNFSSIIDGDFKYVTGKINIKYSSHQGGNLQGVIGNTPLYEDALNKSAVFSVLNNLGITYTNKYTSIRDKIKIKCDSTGNAVELCTPDVGKGCLFNIREDPCENRDVSSNYPEIVERLRKRLNEESQRRIPRQPIYRDPKAEPRLHNYTWSTWM